MLAVMDARERLSRLRVPVDPVAEGLLTLPDAARRLGIDERAVLEAIAHNQLIGREHPAHGMLIPQAQIQGHDQAVGGIPELLAIIPHHELAWAFLDQAWPFLDDVARPIDKLVAGEVQYVVDAASSFGNSPV